MRRSFAVAILAGLVAVAVAGEATAKPTCKSGLTNVHKNRVFEARVVTNWCYENGSVTTRRSIPSAKVTDAGWVLGWRESTFQWTYTGCQQFNGYPKHNCLTHGEFSFSNKYSWWLPKIAVCIQTRIYGNGRHVRAIGGECP